MSAAPELPAARSTAQRVQCWLLTLALLLQSVWLPFHLAAERHLAPGSDLATGALATCALASGEARASLDADAAREPSEPPHSILDHQDQKHVRGDDPDGAQTIASALDGDDGDGTSTPLPLAWLADAPHELPIGRAPPDANAPFHAVRFACPQRLPAAPRAPPLS